MQRRNIITCQFTFAESHLHAAADVTSRPITLHFLGIVLTVGDADTGSSLISGTAAALAAFFRAAAAREPGVVGPTAGLAEARFDFVDFDAAERGDTSSNATDEPSSDMSIAGTEVVAVAEGVAGDGMDVDVGYVLVGSTLR